MQDNILWTFKTRNFKTVLSWEYEECPDLSWDETGEITEKLNSGELGNFTFWVHVFGPNGQELGNSIYANPAEFRDHIGAKGAHGSYFTDMVSGAIGEARKALAGLQSVRLRA